MSFHKAKVNYSLDVSNGRAGGRFKSLIEIDQTPKATSGSRKTRFDPNQHPTINIQANQVQFNNSFCLANIAINNMKSTVKSRERSEENKSLQKAFQQPHTTTNASQKTKNNSSNNKNKYFQLDQQSFQMNNIFPQTETHKGSSYTHQKVNGFKNGSLIGASVDTLQDLVSPTNKLRSNKNPVKRRDPSYLQQNERSYFQSHENQSKSLQKTNTQQTREAFISQHQKIDNSFTSKRDKTVQSNMPTRTIDTIESEDRLESQKIKDSIQTDVKKWEDVSLPITPDLALKYFSNFLNDMEKQEIVQYMNIFYLGHKSSKKSKGQHNNGYDDDKGDYVYSDRDHVGYRYEILGPLGKGSFGSVVKVFDHKRKEEAAVKIIRSKKKFFNQALIELKILKFIKDNDIENQTNIVKIKDFVIFRNHVCIVFELLSINLYEFLKSNNFSGVSLELIRRFSIQILQSLMFLEKAKIVHCDLKPENILLKQINKTGIKLVDFGSSCFENERVYTYIQSRFYRAPEVILGLPYTSPIDMWSFGCIICELFMGYPLFPGENEQEQMQMFMEILGVPQSDFLEPCQRKQVFFQNKLPYQPILPPNSKGKVRSPGNRDINHYLKCADDLFVSFVMSCFTWEMRARMTPSQALIHPWILQGLPQDIRIQHLIQMQVNAPQLNLEELIKKGKGGNQGKDQFLINPLNNSNEIPPVQRIQPTKMTPSVEKKTPQLNNYFLKKQPQLSINLYKPTNLPKDIQSTKNQSNTNFSHHGPMTSKNNPKLDLPSQTKSNFIINYVKDFVNQFSTINHDFEEKKPAHPQKPNRTHQFNIM